MKSKLAILFAVIFSFLTVSAPLFAHHGNSAYDMSKTVPMKATVTKFEYSNPHTQVYYDVTDDKGDVEHWVAETTNPAMLNRVGWSRDSSEARGPGHAVRQSEQGWGQDHVSAEGCVLRRQGIVDGKSVLSHSGADRNVESPSEQRV